MSTRGEEANGTADAPVISPDGRFVAFHSDAPNLAPADSNECWDAFVRDRVLGRTTRVNVASAPHE